MEMAWVLLMSPGHVIVCISVKESAAGSPLRGCVCLVHLLTILFADDTHSRVRAIPRMPAGSLQSFVRTSLSVLATDAIIGWGDRP
jgi:hypothetical protein